MAESEDKTSCGFFGDSVEAHLTTQSEKAAYKHNIKERLRHQKIQSILEHVGKHVPKPSSLKKETKAKCLRRVVLYMKFLLQKSEELKLLPDSGIEDFVPSVPVVAPKRGRKKKSENKKHFVPKINCRKAQIIFLKKFTSSSVEKFSVPIETEKNNSAERDVSSYTAVEVKAKVNGSENYMTPKSPDLLNENFYESSIETATAVSTIINQEKTFPPEKSYLHFSSHEICSNTNEPYAAPDKLAGSIFSKNSLMKRNVINSMKTERGERMQVRKGFSSEPIKQKRRRKIRMPVLSMKKENMLECHDKVSLPNISTFFAAPSASTLETASIPKRSSSLAANSNSTFSAEVADISPETIDETSQNFSSSNDLYSSLLSQFFSDDQEGLPSDFLSSSETTTIPSSNEFISDDADNVSLTRTDSMESPEIYPDIFGSMSSEENQAHRASYETLSDIESIIRNESLPKLPGMNASSFVPSSKSNAANLYHNLNVLNAEKPCGFDLNSYSMSETPGFVNCSFIPQPIGIIPDDILNFQTSVPEYFYLYPNIENKPVLLSNDIDGSQSDEFSPGMDLDFCEAFSEPTMYSNAQPSSSYPCDMLKNVQIKEEILDMLPDEEISASLNHLGNFGW